MGAGHRTSSSLWFSCRPAAPWIFRPWSLTAKARRPAILHHGGVLPQQPDGGSPAASRPSPTILATSGGWIPGRRTPFELGPLVTFAIELAGVSGRPPRLCHVGTAMGDPASAQAAVSEAGRVAGVEITHLNLFPMPNLDNMEGHLLDQDVVWVNGGSVANLLAVWRLHRLDSILRRVWEAGVVLGGVSAGSICWHVGGVTDSFGPDLQVLDDGLGILPYSNGVHYDSEPERRPRFQAAIATGRLPSGYATDDGVGLVYRGTTFVEAVSQRRGQAAYHVQTDGYGRARETRIEPRLLPNAS